MFLSPYPFFFLKTKNQIKKHTKLNKNQYISADKVQRLQQQTLSKGALEEALQVGGE